MQNGLNLKDIIRMAVTNEERGRDFYRSMAKRVADGATKQVFLNLAEEEEYHARAFAQIGEELAADGPLEPEAGSYLKAIAGSSVLPDEGPAAFAGGTLQALAIGIQAEKDSILLYHQLYEHSHHEKARQLISRLLKNEKMHLVELREMEQEARKGSLPELK